MADNGSPKKPPPKSPLTAAIFLVCGLALLLVSFAWSGKSASRAAWSEEQAKAYQSASIKLHDLSQVTAAGAGSNNDKTNREKLAKAEADYKAIRSQLDSAIDRPTYITYAMRIAGSLMAIAGLTLINLDRRSDG